LFNCATPISSVISVLARQKVMVSAFYCKF
jgi:hypothetical protein